MEDQQVKCSFCGRKKNEVDVMIAGVTGHICNHCISQAQNIVKEEVSDKSNKDLEDQIQLLKPKEIKAHLDEYIIGQEEAKKVLSVAVYNHYKRLLQVKDATEEVEIEKSNILMVGETGTGKTLLAKTIAKILHVPFCVADATVFTEAGYVGEDVESIITRLLQASNYNVEATERGIVFIDEVDKISRKGDNPSITRDIKEGTQQALLKLLEDSIINVAPEGGRKHPDAKMVQVNTKNILFICGGAFDGITRKIANRLQTQAIGFKSADKEELDENNMLQYVAPQDVKAFGLIPELIGRLPVLTHLNPLDEEALRRILTEPKNSIIKQYVRLFELDDIKISFDKGVFDFIVEKAMEYKLGARGLRSICEAIMLDAMYDLPSDEGKKEHKITLRYAKAKFNKSKISSLKVA
jgi:ATP-dependent Clp protease ATP-binding subunit ClpX